MFMFNSKIMRDVIRSASHEDVDAACDYLRFGEWTTKGRSENAEAIARTVKEWLRDYTPELLSAAHDRLYHNGGGYRRLADREKFRYALYPLGVFFRRIINGSL